MNFPPIPAAPAGETRFAAPGWFDVPFLTGLHLAIIVASNYLVQWPVQLLGVLTT